MQQFKNMFWHIFKKDFVSQIKCIMFQKYDIGTCKSVNYKVLRIYDI